MIKNYTNMFVISLQLLKSILVRVSAVLDSITKNRLVNGNNNKRNKGVDLLKNLPSPPPRGKYFSKIFFRSTSKSAPPF